MRVLVTGAAGFIGQHLMARLRADGHEPWGVDDFSTSNTRSAEGVERYDVTEDDLAYQIDRGHMGGGRPEVIYHLACPASPVHYQKDPIKTLETAFVGTTRILFVAKKLGCAVVLASTSEVYGDPEVSPQTESYLGRVSTLGPRACYDEGKRAAEAAAWAYRTELGVDVRIARIFNTYGPGMARGDGRLVPTLVCQALAGEPMTVKGDGSQKRSLCYVDDTVDALVRIAGEERREYLPVYNVGNPDEREVRHIAGEIERAVERSTNAQHGCQGHLHAKTIYVSADKDDPRQRCPDIARIQRELGWAPVVPLAEGLRRTVDYFRRLG